MSFQYKKRDEEWTDESIKRIRNGWRNHIGTDPRAESYICLVENLKKRGIIIECRRCAYYLKCPDKLALLLIGNGSINSLLEEQKENPTKHCDSLYNILGILNELYKTDEKIKSLFQSPIKTNNFH